MSVPTPTLDGGGKLTVVARPGIVFSAWLPGSGSRPVMATKPLFIPALIVVLARLASAARSSRRVKAAKAHAKLSPGASG